MTPKHHYGLLALLVLLAWWYLRKPKTATPAAVPAPIPDTYVAPPVEDSTTGDVELIGPDIVVEIPGLRIPDPPSADQTPSSADGSSYATFQGYQFGDFSDAALAGLSRQSQWHLALTQSPHASGYGSPMSIWQDWINNRGDGSNGPAVGSQFAYKESIRTLVSAAFDGYNGMVDGMNNPVPDSFRGW